MMTSRGTMVTFFTTVSLVELLDKVGWHAPVLQHLHEQVGHAVVDGPLAGDGALLQAVEGGGVILVFHNKARGVVGLENLFWPSP